MLKPLLSEQPRTKSEPPNQMTPDRIKMYHYGKYPITTFPVLHFFFFKTDCCPSLEGVVLNPNPVPSLISVFLNKTFCLFKPSLFGGELFQDFWALTQVNLHYLSKFLKKT